MKIGIVVFPGSNCDRDVERAAEVTGADSGFIWHKQKSVEGYDAIVLPGGFAHGDYLRCGAIARFSPIMDAVIEFANDGGPVLGICNGFQVLLESGLLPGVTLRNRSLKFICRPQKLRVENVKDAIYKPLFQRRGSRLPHSSCRGQLLRRCGYDKDTRG